MTQWTGKQAQDQDDLRRYAGRWQVKYCPPGFSQRLHPHGSHAKQTGNADRACRGAPLSSIVGLIRGVSELRRHGRRGLIYTVASVLLWLSVGPVRLDTLPRSYRLWGSLMFVSYELCLSLSIGYANTGRQAIEVGMVNYLWPSFTMLAAILFNRQRANWLIVPGFLIAILGITSVLGGDRGWTGEHDEQCARQPLSYGPAFAGAVIWAGYCTVTARIAQGKNGVTLFFILTASALWAKYLFTGGAPMSFSANGMIHGTGGLRDGLRLCRPEHRHPAWQRDGAGRRLVLHPGVLGRPAAALLHTPLSFAFWKGAAMVCAGSILCWLATRGRGERASPAADSSPTA